MKYPGTHTILDVKTGVYTLTDVPVRNQQWQGWPNLVKGDETTLAQSGISFPEHNLSVSQIPVKEKKEKVELILIFFLFFFFQIQN